MIEYGSIPGVEKPVSRIFFGTAIGPMSRGKDCDALLDAALEAGIDAFDTARVYGRSENSLGRWMKARGNQEKLVLLTKCGHHNILTGRRRVTEQDIRADLAASSRALGTDYFDIYLLHRDDPQVEVGQIVELMNQLHREGRIGAYGGSNWSHQRIRQANDYAAAHGLLPMALSSPQYSLMRQVKPTARDCITLTGPENREARQFYEKTGLPVISYSSLGGGFLKAAGSENAPACFNCPDNFQRLERCRELAAQKGTTVSQIALAWLLHSPMNLFPAISSTSPQRMAENLGAFQLRLTPEEWEYLDFQPWNF